MSKKKLIMSNSFSSAFISASKIVPTRNGGNILSTSEDVRVDVFNNLNRNTDNLTIISNIQKMISEVCDGEYVADIFRIWLHKRHAREGEKEKLLSYRYFLQLYDHFPETCVKIAGSPLFGEIGYWKDYYLIWGLINKMEMKDADKFRKYDKLIMAFRSSILSQRIKDLKKIEEYISCKPSTVDNETLEKLIKQNFEKSGNKLSVSFVGKYCVREKSALNTDLYWYLEDGSDIKIESHVSYMIRGSLKQKVKSNSWVDYPVDKSVPFSAKKTYRNLNAKLNIVLNVPECLMCANRFGEMEPESFPSVFMKKNAKALLNEKLKETVMYYHEETGNRHPFDEGRVSLRQKMRNMLLDPSKINASQLFPHEISYKAFNATSKLESQLYEGLWESKIIETRSKMDDTRLMIINEMASACKSNLSDKVRLAISSGNFIGCADVSGSMECGKKPNRPIDVAVGLTLFMSEIASPSFKNLAMSFTDNPYIFNLEGKTLNEKRNALFSNVGFNTNYMRMHEALISLCIKNKVNQEDIPVIVVYTDGDFDQMDSSVCGKWDTIHESIVKMWVQAGYTKIPTIVYWNLNGKSLGVQTRATHKGVIFLQGCSSNNFKYILYGETADDAEIIVDGKKVLVSSITPYDIFRKAMTGEHFMRLENILKESHEGLLGLYN